MRDFKIVKHCTESRNWNLIIFSLHSHCQFVSKIPSGCLSHSWNSEMLPNQSGLFYIKVVESHHQVYFSTSHQMSCTFNKCLKSVQRIVVVFEIKKLINTFSWPRFVFYFFVCQQKNRVTFFFGGLKKFHALEICTNTKYNHLKIFFLKISY